jgi:hypothetical protein
VQPAVEDDAARRAWPHLRAALILLHGLALVLGAVPAPEGGMRRAAWKEPTVQGEIAAWAERLDGLGVAMDAETLEREAWDFAVRYMAVRRSVLAPFQPYYERLGVAQNWRMFVAPHKHPARLQIAVDGGPDVDPWRVVYEELRPGTDWKEAQLEHDRTRSVLFRYSWKAYRKDYRRMCAWIAAEAATDFPEASRVRVRWLRQRTPSPAEVRKGQLPALKPESEQILDLGPLRDGGRP